MKTIFLTSLAMSLGAFCLAQPPPTSPPKPATSTTVSTSSSTSSNYVRSVSKSDQDMGGNLSIAISESDGTYKLRAKFPSKNDAALKELLINEFGKENLKRDGKNWIWTLASDNDEIYNIKFYSGKLRIELDKEHAANSLTEKFLRTGEEIQKLLSGGDDQDQKSEALQRKAEHLQRDAQRMQREAERLEKRDSQFMEKEEVIALKNKAKNLQQKVDSLQRVVKKLKEN